MSRFSFTVRISLLQNITDWLLNLWFKTLQEYFAVHFLATGTDLTTHGIRRPLIQRGSSQHSPCLQIWRLVFIYELVVPD